MNLTESNWRQVFRPSKNAITVGTDFYERGNLKDMEFLAKLDPKYIWSEITDWDTNTTYLTNGYVTNSDAVYWYVCEVPCDKPFFEIVVDLEEWIGYVDPGSE